MAVTAMSGIQTGLFSIYKVLYDIPGPTNLPTGQPHVWFFNDPATLNSLGVTAVGTNAKVNLIRCKYWYMYSNTSGLPIWLRIQKFVFRKDVSFSDYSTFGALLSDGAVVTTVPYINPTLGNSACRHVKWIGTKWIKIPGGDTKRIAFRRRFNKDVSGNEEGDTQYMGRAGFTTGVYITIVTSPLDSIAYTVASPTPVRASVCGMGELAWRDMGIQTSLVNLSGAFPSIPNNPGTYSEYFSIPVPSSIVPYP